jgi:hypothetical protein
VGVFRPPHANVLTEIGVTPALRADFPHISHTGLADTEQHSTDQTDVAGREHQTTAA